MPVLSDIKIDQVDCIQDWRHAEIGHLLQIGGLPNSSLPRGPAVVLRSDDTLPVNGPALSVLGIEDA